MTDAQAAAAAAPAPAPVAAPMPAEQVKLTPEKQIFAQQIGSVFNSLHTFLHTLEHDVTDAEGNTVKAISDDLKEAHKRLIEAGNWAVRHALTWGRPPQPAKNPVEVAAAAAAAPATNEAAPAPEAAAAPAPVIEAAPASAVEVAAPTA